MCTPIDDSLLKHLLIVSLQGDGREEVVACAWDGQTYIIDHNRTVVRFQFDENVNAFCAGEGPGILKTILFIRHFGSGSGYPVLSRTTDNVGL